jgi:hypothetical protein
MSSELQDISERWYQAWLDKDAAKRLKNVSGTNGT